MPVKKQQKVTSSGMPSFSFQFEEPRCRGVLINSLKSLQPIRSIWSLAVINANGGSDVGGIMQRMPAIPGITLIVEPKTKKLIFEDPLEKDTELLAKINAVMRDVSAIAPAGGKSVRHTPRRELQLDDDTFKTLVIELAYMNGPDCQIKLVMQKGSTFPTDEEIEKLPGRELYDVRSNSHIQPKYVEDVAEYHERLVFSGNR